MICAIGVKPDACAIAYSLTLRSLLNTGERAAATRFRLGAVPC